MSVELFSENIYPESTLAELFSGNSSNRSVGGIIEGANIKSSAGSGGVAILPPENTNIGIYVYDNDGNTVFNTLIDGENVGDVYLGDFANNQGIWYDKSAGASGTVYIKGNVYIGGTTVFESGYDPSGKANVFRQDTAPATGMVEKDIWIDTDNGDKPYSYNGSAWVAQYTIIDGGSISTGTIDADIVDVTHLDADNITAGTLVVGRTEAKCTDANADQTSVNTSANTNKVQNYTIISGGKIATSFLTADNIQTGTLLGRTIQTDVDGDNRIEIGGGYNWMRYYDSANKIGTSLTYIEASDAFLISGDAPAAGFVDSSIYIIAGTDETILFGIVDDVILAIENDQVKINSTLRTYENSYKYGDSMGSLYVYDAGTGSGDKIRGGILFSDSNDAMILSGEIGGVDGTDSDVFIMANSGKSVNLTINGSHKLGAEDSLVRFYTHAIPNSLSGDYSLGTSTLFWGSTYSAKIYTDDIYTKGGTHAVDVTSTVFDMYQPIGLRYLSSNPASPSQGWLYYDTTKSTLVFYNGSAWRKVSDTAY